jgi:hypothetical protein
MEAATGEDKKNKNKDRKGTSVSGVFFFGKDAKNNGLKKRIF